MKNTRTLSNRVCAALLAAVLLLSTLVVPAAADSGDVSYTRLDNAAVTAQLPLQEADGNVHTQPYRDNDIVRVSILLEQESTVSRYDTAKIAENTAAMRYRQSLERRQESMARTISRKALGGEKLDVCWNLTLAANLISANVEYGQIDAIRSIRGVKDVVIETRYEPCQVDRQEVADPSTATSGAMIGSSAAYASGYTGAGRRIAVIDTGICEGHLSFDGGALEYSLRQQAQAAGKSYESYTASLHLLDTEEIAQKLPQLHIRDGITAAQLYRSTKIAFAYNYVDSGLRIDHNDESGEHGSHVSGICVANSYIPDGKGGYENALDTVHVQGVAPDAQILTMKVFGTSGGAYDSDYLAAIEDAIVLNCDAANLSLGSPNPGFVRSSTAAYQAIMDSLDQSSLVVAIAAGNAHGWADYSAAPAASLYAEDVSLQTVGTPGTYRNSLCVASVDNDGYTGGYFTVNSKAVFYDESSGFKNVPLAALAGDREYVLIDGLGTQEEFAALHDVLDGKIAVCARGSINFSTKANNAVEYGGASGVIIYNNQSGTFGMDLTDYTHEQPCVAISQVDGELMRQNGRKNTLADGSVYYAGTLTVANGVSSTQYHSLYYTMSGFSSWGVPGDLSMKPEITAPGGSIYSVNGLRDTTSYETMSGTSMAAPQVAGMSALVGQYLDESHMTQQTGLSARTLAQSLLMSTARPLEQSAGQYYSVLKQGAGLANVGAAIAADSYILMNEDATVSYSDGKVKAELGDDPDRTGTYTFSFDIHNLTDTSRQFSLSARLFTQDLFEDTVNEQGDMGSYLDTATIGLESVADWSVNGQAVSAASVKYDFNGDGVVNGQDCLALLDVVTGKRTELYNRENADFDSDGRITSYDAYCFLEQLRTSEPMAEVPADGSIRVSVTLTLTDSQKKALDDNYPNGAYVEGYVFARGANTADGAAGTEHSIPVLGYYGRWSDPSMYDVGTRILRTNGEEKRTPYTGVENANYFTVSYASDPTAVYYFGGNPLIPAETYRPERNALNTQRGDTIRSVGYSLIRCADAGRITVTNHTQNTRTEESLAREDSAFYYINGGQWYNTRSEAAIRWTPWAAQEGDEMEIELTMATEYDRKADGSVDWDSLGAGASLTMPFVVDNTAPVFAADPVLNSKVLRLTAQDNRYIAGIVLYSADGGKLVGVYPVEQDKAGQRISVELDLSELPDSVYTVQLVDYALNISTYRLFLNVEPTREVEQVQVSSSRMRLLAGNSAQLTAAVLPVSIADASVVWTSSNENVATVSDIGLVTAVREGSCVVRATSKLDDTKYAECTVTVYTIDKNLTGIIYTDDEAASLADFSTKDPAAFQTRRMLDESYFAMSYGGDGNLYAAAFGSNNSTLYRLDAESLDATKLATQEAIYADIAPAPSVNNRTGGLAAVYGPYLLLLDSDGNFVSAGKECSNYLVGIAYKGTTYNRFFDTWLDSYLLLDDQGNVYQQSIGYVPLYGGYYTFLTASESLLFKTGVQMNIPLYGSSAYYDGDYLYWAVFDDVKESSTLFAIDEFAETCQRLGEFGEGNWPAVGLLEWGKPLYTDRADENLAVLTSAAQAMNMTALPALEPSGGVTAAEPQEEDHTLVTVNVAVSEAVNNGKLTVSYDPTVLELRSVRGLADYVSDHAKDGEIIMAWADQTAVENVGQLTFRRLTNDATTVTVTTLESGTRLELRQIEEISLEAVACDHEFGQWTVSKSATCTEPGTETRTCILCGQTETREIPAGHDPQLRGRVDATCTKDGSTGDMVCAVCGKVLEKARVIRALGHTYENGCCVRCGVKQSVLRPGVRTGDGSLILLWVSAAAISGAASVALLRRRRTR